MIAYITNIEYDTNGVPVTGLPLSLEFDVDEDIVLDPEYYMDPVLMRKYLRDEIDRRSDWLAANFNWRII